MLAHLIRVLVLTPRGLSCFKVGSVLWLLTNEWSIGLTAAVLVIFFTLRDWLGDGQLKSRALIVETLLSPLSVYLGLRVAALVVEAGCPHPVAVRVILVTCFLALQGIEAVALHDLPALAEVVKKKLGK